MLSCRNIGLIAALVAVVAVFALGACARSTGEGFAIYLTQDDVPPAQMAILSHVDVADRPVIAIDDVVSYDAETHEMTLTATAYKRVSELEVPVSGRSFVVCVDRGPVYWGAFWTPISSLSFGGVAIMQPLGAGDATTLRLALGYPSPSFYGGQDPRENEEVLRSLEEAGKLK